MQISRKFDYVYRIGGPNTLSIATSFLQLWKYEKDYLTVDTVHVQKQIISDGVFFMAIRSLLYGIAIA